MKTSVPGTKWLENLEPGDMLELSPKHTILYPPKLALTGNVQYARGDFMESVCPATRGVAKVPVVVLQRPERDAGEFGTLTMMRIKVLVLDQVCYIVRVPHWIALWPDPTEREKK